MAKKKVAAKKRDNVFSKVVQGRWISTNFFARNAITLIAALFFMMVYISNKYECQTKMETIQGLEVQERPPFSIKYSH